MAVGGTATPNDVTQPKQQSTLILPSGLPDGNAGFSVTLLWQMIVCARVAASTAACAATKLAITPANAIA